MTFDRATLAPKLFETLERMRAVMNLEPGDWAERLDMSVGAYRAIAKGRKGPPADRVLAISEKLDLDLENLVSGKIDYAVLAAKHSGIHTALPERYATAAFSRRRTSINVLEYVNLTEGWQSMVSLLRRFQLNEAVFADPEKLISLRFLADLCEMLARDGRSSRALFNMGAYSAHTNRNSSFTKALGAVPGPSQLYARFFGGVVNEHYDRNFSYQIVRLNSAGCLLEIVDRSEVNDALGLKKLGNKHLCELRAGSIASLPEFVGWPFSDVREVACRHRGDEACRYEVLFKQPVVLPLAARATIQ